MARGLIVLAGILICLALAYVSLGSGPDQEPHDRLVPVKSTGTSTPRGSAPGVGVAPTVGRGAAEISSEGRVSLPPRDWKELEKLKRRGPQPGDPSEIEDRVRAILGRLEGTDTIDTEAAIEQLSSLAQRAREQGLSNLGEVLTGEDPAMTEVRENIDRFLQSVQDGDYSELLDAIPGIEEAQLDQGQEPAASAGTPAETQAPDKGQ